MKLTSKIFNSHPDSDGDFFLGGGCWVLGLADGVCVCGGGGWWEELRAERRCVQGRRGALFDLMWF